MLTLLVLGIVFSPVFLGVATSSRATKTEKKVCSTIGLVLASGGILALAVLLPMAKIAQPATSWWDIFALKDTRSVLIGHLIGLVLAIFFAATALISAKKIQQTSSSPAE